MSDVAIVGGGPADLSAALFTGKNGLETTVFDTDQTWLHKAHLFNYPGIRSIDGSSYLEVLREQVDDFGVDRQQDTAVTAVQSVDEGLTVTTDDGEYTASYVVLATGANREIAETAGCAFTEENVIEVDVTMESSVDNLYATGAMVRAEEW